MKLLCVGNGETPFIFANPLIYIWWYICLLDWTLWTSLTWKPVLIYHWLLSVLSKQLALCIKDKSICASILCTRQWIGSGDYTYLLGWNDINNYFCQLTTRVWGSEEPTNVLDTTHIGVQKITEACNPKMGFKICEGILCFSFSVKELDVIVNKKYFPCMTLLNFWPFCNPHY